MASEADQDRIPTIWERPPPEDLPRLRAIWWEMRRAGLYLPAEPGVIVVDGDDL